MYSPIMYRIMYRSVTTRAATVNRNTKMPLMVHAQNPRRMQSAQRISPGNQASSSWSQYNTYLTKGGRVARKEYRSEQIAVSFDLERCFHVRNCVRGLPEVVK
jgi:predicted amidohydrolase